MNRRQLLKDRPFIYRYPRLSVTVLTTSALLVFFSKPIYDIFFNKEEFDVEEFKRTHKSRFSKS